MSKYTVIGVFLGSHKTIVQYVEADSWRGAWDGAMERYQEHDTEALN